MTWTFLSPEPGGERAGWRQEPSEPAQALGHTWALDPARARPAQHPRSSQKGPSGWSQADWKSPADNSLSVASLSLFPLRHSPPLSIAPSPLLARRCRRTRAHRCVRLGWAVEASPANTWSACDPLPARLRLPARPSRLQGGTIKTMSIMSPFHFRKGRS